MATATAGSLLSTKALTLRRLAPLIETATIDRGHIISLRNWHTRSPIVVDFLATAYHGGALIVRSSAPGEDTMASSAAGRYDSVAIPEHAAPNVLRAAIDQVFSSYGDDRDDSYVFVQRYIDAGVGRGSRHHPGRGDRRTVLRARRRRGHRNQRRDHLRTSPGPDLVHDPRQPPNGSFTAAAAAPTHRRCRAEGHRQRPARPRTRRRQRSPDPPPPGPPARPAPAAGPRDRPGGAQGSRHLRLPAGS
ncbi:hypothetical protein F1D05_10790 [Kribbella qitaiheensis]|uniref:Uncharacterized protein n=1 Tax=Kribbella qitaiheensis TaxID=1544730 RepID=A0A7G6WWC4_9ACTN|nr:hypothetical protein F1D05_10790 [Kribbella qitaiheensis]